MRFIVKNLRSRIDQFRAYRNLLHSLNTQFPNASKEELITLNDSCAICREPMVKAKKLPCNHFFHVACLRTWLETHQSCPTCRRELISKNNTDQAQRTHHTTHNANRRNVENIFSFTSDRWLSWLPSIQVEISRHSPNTEQQMIQHLIEMFPHLNPAIIVADLQRTRSTQLTIDRILNGVVH
jgi:hypothetical protein